MVRMAGGTPREIESRVEAHVVGRRAACQALAREAHALLQGIGLDLGPRRLLLVGDVGTGKRHLLRALSAACNLPVVTCAAIQLADGEPLARIGSELLELSRTPVGGPLPAGILHVQGLDAIAAQPVAREALFGLLRGRTARIVHEGRILQFDSRRLLVVASVGLPELSRAIANRTGASSGYFAQARGEDRARDMRPGEEPDRRATEADLVTCGLDPVLLDHFPKFEVLEVLGQRELVRVLKLPGGPLERLRGDLDALGLELELGQDALERLAARCAQDGTDRLERELEALFTQVRHDGPELPLSGIGVVRLVRSGAHGLRVVRLRKSSRIQVPSPRVASAQPKQPTLPPRPPRAAVNTYGSDRWATLEDLAPLTTQPPTHGVWLQGDLVVERGRNPALLELHRNRGVCLADNPLDPELDIRRKNLLAIGKVGSGKTSRLILPLLRQDIADPRRSLVVIDAQGELTKFVYGWARKYRGPNARIVYFNPKDPRRSAAWNPIDAVRTNSEIRDFALTLASAAQRGERDSPYFTQQASTLLIFVLTALRRVEPSPNLGQVRRLLQRGFGALRELAQRTEHRELASWLEQGTNNQNMGTSWSELDNMLECWSDEDVCACTERTEFSFDSLEEPTILVFETPEQFGQAKLAGLRALFIHEYFRFLMQRGATREATELSTIPLYVDEFASAVGRLHELHLRCNTLRKRGLAIVAAVQYLDQIESLYGRDGAKAVLAAMGTKVFLPPLHEADAAFASSYSGTMTVETATAAASGAVASVDLVSAPVMTPGDVRCVPFDRELGARATLSLPSVPWFQMYLRPWFEETEDRTWFDSERESRGSEAFRPPLRATPLAPTPAADPKATSQQPAPRTFGEWQLDTSSTRGLSKLELEERLAELRKALNAERTMEEAARWWTEFEQLNDLRDVIAVAEQLVRCKASVLEFHGICRTARTDDVVASLLELERRRRVALVYGQGLGPEAAKRHGRARLPQSRPSKDAEDTPPATPEASGAPEQRSVSPAEEILRRLENRVAEIKARSQSPGKRNPASPSAPKPPPPRKRKNTRRDDDGADTNEVPF